MHKNIDIDISSNQPYKANICIGATFFTGIFVMFSSKNASFSNEQNKKSVMLFIHQYVCTYICESDKMFIFMLLYQLI